MAVKDPYIGEQIGNYTILDLVGRGGMGTVYRAQDPAGGPDLALKVLSLDTLEDLREIQRFQREAQLAAQLDHPHIVAVYGTGREDSCLYMAMELVEGQSLRAALRQHKRLEVDQALTVATQVLEALDCAHAQKIIHRDIKAENLLITPEGAAKLLDFGVAKLQGGTALTRVDEILGTVEYMAPEQILGDELGPTTDLYAAGVLLYEMLTGVLPFTGDSPATLVYHQLNEEVRPPSMLNPTVNRALDHFVLRLLEKIPEDRYPSAGAALESLGPIRGKQQLLTGPGVDGAVQQAAEEEQLFRTRGFKPRFIGRRAEEEQLREHYQAVSNGGRVIYLAGEAGVGKSRLMAEFGRYVESHGGRVVEGDCFFEHGMGPFMPFLDVLGNLFGKAENGLSDDERRELGDLLRAEAPELAELAGASTTTAKVRAGFSTAFNMEDGDPQSGRQRLFDTVFNVLQAAARRTPLLVILEDAHWADEGSVQLLQYLQRRAAEAHVLLLVSYEPEELAADEDGLGALLQQLEIDGTLHQLTLDRLPLEGIAQMVRSLFLETEFTDDFIEFIYDQSQGNPFIAIEVLKLLRQQEVLYCDSGIWSARTDFNEAVVPDRVNSLIMRRVDHLDEEDRELLQTAAVIGPRFTSQVLQAAADLSRMALLKALFRLEKRCHLITARDGVYEFTHPKIAEVLYAEIPWELRGEYHMIVAEALLEQQEQGRPVAPAELGRHFFQAEEYAQALPYLRLAAQSHYQLYGWRQAATLYDQAAEACRQTVADGEALLDSLKMAGRAYLYLTVYDKALERFTQMRQAAQETGDTATQADAYLQQAEAEKSQGHFSTAQEACQAALDGIDTDPVLNAKALLLWGVLDFEQGRHDDAEQRWQESLNILTEAAPEKASHALNNLAVIATVRGDLEQAWTLYERSLEATPEDGEETRRVQTYYNMGMLRGDQQRWDDALALYDRSLELCKKTRFVSQEPVIELNRAEALIGKQAYAQARETCHRVLRGFRRLDDVLGVADTLRLLGQLCRCEGHWDEGEGYLEKSIELNRGVGESISLGEALYELGVLQRNAGHPPQALELLQEAEQIFTRAQAALDLDRVRKTLDTLKAA